MKRLLILCFLVLSIIYSAESNDDTVKNLLEDQQFSKQEGNVFPCEISENSVENVPIFFYGENHSSAIDRRVREYLLLSGTHGDIYLGLEGNIYGDILGLNSELNLFLNSHDLELDIDQSKVFGLEEEFVHTLIILPKIYVMLYRAINGLFGEEVRLPRYKLNFLLTLWGTPLLHKLWREIQRPLANLEDEALAVFIDELILIPNSEDKMMLSKLTIIQKLPVWQKNDAFLRLSKRIAENFISNQTSAFPTEMPNLDVYSAFLNNPENLSHENRFAFEIAIRWRDSFMVKNIMHIYCSAFKEEKPLALVVGHLHVENLSNLLNQASSGRIEILEK